MFPTQKLFGACPAASSCTLSPCLFSHAATAPPPSSERTRAPSLKRPAESSSAAGPSKVSKPATGATTRTIAALARPPPAPVAKTIVAGNVGPPKLNAVGNTHTAFPTRTKMLNALYDQFLLLYAAVPNGPSIASQHALQQETTLYKNSNKMTYRNAIISALARLKKRPPAKTVNDTCTLEDEVVKQRQKVEDEKGRLTRERVKGYVHSLETLKKFEYMVEVPEGRGGDEETQEGLVRKCDRCGVEWTVRAELSEEDKNACSYHFGRIITEKIAGVRARVFSCCPSNDSAPCQSGPHVFRDSQTSVLHSRAAFVTTSSIDRPPPHHPPSDLIALDCEMIYTTAGMSLARVTAVDAEGAVVVDEHVKPKGTVLDVNTRFSGVKEGDLEKAKYGLEEVREELAKWVGEETILVGHGLENDLKALRWVHTKVIDTAILFPHPNGGTWRKKLRDLSREYLGKFIQQSDSSVGHSALDDSQAALELLRYKVKQQK